MNRCSWCGRPSEDLVERPNADGDLWCRDDVACQAARKAVRSSPRLRIAQR